MIEKAAAKESRLDPGVVAAQRIRVSLGGRGQAFGSQSYGVKA
jgi:hypothetical protein